MILKVRGQLNTAIFREKFSWAISRQLQTTFFVALNQQQKKFKSTGKEINVNCDVTLMSIFFFHLKCSAHVLAVFVIKKAKAKH